MNPTELLAFLRERLNGGRSRPHQRTKTILKKSDLHLELLEARDQPAVIANPTAISGFVYLDANNDGLFQAGETPLANSTVELLDSSGNLITTTTTNAQGFYQFTNDPNIDTSPKTLTKTFNFPEQMTDATETGTIDQFDPSLGQLTSVEIINAGTITSDISAENTSRSSGTTINASVSGTLTLSGSGFQVVTSIDNNAGSFNASVFDGTLDFSGGSGKDFGSHDATGSNSTTLTGSAMQAFVGTGSLSLSEMMHATSTASGGGNVLVGVQSQGMANVQVIYHYTPSNALPPGDYILHQSPQPPGTIDGKISSGGQLIPHQPNQDYIQVHLTNGTSTDNDFGKLLPASLSGYVYWDANDDGRADSGDAAIPGFVVTLTGTDYTGAAVNLTTTSAGDGSYSFNNLLAGNYTITQTDGPGWIDAVTSAGSQGGTAGNNVISGINLGQSVHGVNNDFGKLKPSALSGYVYYDINRNGVADAGDSSIQGVVVTLTGTDDRGNAVSMQAVTDPNGFYQFLNLRSGTYNLTETPPSGYQDGADTVGSQGGTVGHEQLLALPLSQNENGVNNDFGHVINPISPFPPPPVSPPPVSPPPVSPPPPAVFSKDVFLSSSSYWRKLLGL